MGVRTPFYFVICVDDDEEDVESVAQPVMDAELYNYYYGDDEDEVDRDDDAYSTASSCHEYNCSSSSLLDDIDSVFGDDEDICDFDVDFPSYTKREGLSSRQQYYNVTLPDSYDYHNDYEDDEYSLPAEEEEEWEETINDVRQAADETNALLVDKQRRRRYGQADTSPPQVV
ncbi:MAG: hypothetical protein SGBAC_012218 [Bacillariaceae sp.]